MSGLRPGELPTPKQDRREGDQERSSGAPILSVDLPDPSALPGPEIAP